MNITITLNDKQTTPKTLGNKGLLNVLRDTCGLTGTRTGGSKRECGVCSILFDGQIAHVCLMPACQADGHDAVTIEWFKTDGQVDTVQHSGKPATEHSPAGIAIGSETPKEIAAGILAEKIKIRRYG